MLQGGRGLRRGFNSFVEQGEAFELRQQAQKTQGLLFVSPLIDPVAALTTGATVNGHLHMTHVGYLPSDVIVVEGRLNVTGVAAGRVITCALYTYEDSIYSMVPGSLFRVDGSSAGTKICSIEPVQLQAGPLYAIGLLSLYAGAGAVSVTASTGAGGFMNRTKSLTGVTKMPGRVHIDSFNNVSDVNRMVIYMSQRGKECL